MNPEVFVHYTVGIDLLDAEHWEILKLIDLITLQYQHKEYDTSYELFKRVKPMLIAHYASEEEMMERIQFPYREYHVTTHAKILQEVEKIESFLCKESFFMVEHFALSLRRLTLDHLDTMDRQYISWYATWKQSTQVT
jgi:hemerythrin-like metal-binding protein